MHIVKHTISIPPGTPTAELLSELRALKGMQQADITHHKLTLKYDVIQLQWHTIDPLIRHCLNNEVGLLYPLQSWLLIFTDQNQRDNATYQPRCCNKPPR